MTEKRLNSLSTDPKTFNSAKPSYQVALRQPKFKHELEYAKKKQRNKKDYVL